MNAPVALAVPSSVIKSDRVGLPDMFHTMPWAVGLGLPKSVIFPFPVTVLVPTAVTACVVTTGTAMPVP